MTHPADHGRFLRYFCVLAICAGACQRAPPPPPASPITVRLVSGFPGAGFYPLGAALARGYEQVLPGIRIDVRGGTGSVGDAQALQRGEADIGFVFADVAYVAHKGALEEQRVPFDNLRGIAVLQVAALHVAVRHGLDARDLGALRGRCVAIGPAGRGTALIAQMVMRAYGVEPGEFEALHYLAEREGRVVSRGELLREVWGYLDMPNTRAVDHAIARLRKKIEIDPHQPRFIQTVVGDGYRLTMTNAPLP